MKLFRVLVLVFASLFFVNQSFAEYPVDKAIWLFIGAEGGIVDVTTEAGAPPAGQPQEVDKDGEQLGGKIGLSMYWKWFGFAWTSS